MRTPAKRILVTGGCGFVGSSLALRFRQSWPEASIICLDNLKRRGSELNIARLREQGVSFLHGDIRAKEDLDAAGKCDLLLECSAEPSVLAGYGESPEYLVNTNLVGALNCLEFARKQGAALVFLSTSRVYPYAPLDGLRYTETESRFEPEQGQAIPGFSAQGVAETFPLEGARSLYGASKLAFELLLHEYNAMYGVPAVINRCGVLAGPWQFGKVDQGVTVLWVARHHFKRELAYIGYGGLGKQVRDMLHVDDLFELLLLQLADLPRHAGQVYNVGGGREGSVSLRELSALCERATGNRIPVASQPENRPADLRWYVSDCAKVHSATGWRPRRSPEEIVTEIAAWIRDNESLLETVLG